MPRRSFTDEQILAMRQMYVDNEYIVDIARAFGCRAGNVSLIVNGHLYAHLPVPPRRPHRLPQRVKRQRRMAECHPDRFRAANGLCGPCDRRERVLSRKYGLTMKQHAAIVEAQGDQCPICGGKPTDTDHDHETGRVRGVLCHWCNTGIGNLRESPERLARAATYLSRWTDGKPLFWSEHVPF